MLVRLGFVLARTWNVQFDLPVVQLHDAAVTGFVLVIAGRGNIVRAEGEKQFFFGGKIQNGVHQPDDRLPRN